MKKNIKIIIVICLVLYALLAIIDIWKLLTFDLVNNIAATIFVMGFVFSVLIMITSKE